jgi:hypothetical protein
MSGRAMPFRLEAHELATSHDAQFYRGALTVKTERRPPTDCPPLRLGAEALLTASLDHLGKRMGIEVASPAAP